MKGRNWLIGGLVGAGLAGAGLVGWIRMVPAQTPAGAVAAPVGAKAVATVNGEAITAAELDAALKVAGPVPVQLPEEQRKQQRREVLARLIDERLMHQFLLKNAQPVPAAEVNKKLVDLDAALKKQGKTLAEFCRDTNQTEAELRQRVAFEIQWANYARPRVTDRDAADYYKEYRDFFDGVTVRASHIVIRMTPGASESEKAQARAKLLDLRNQITAGKLDFAQAAKTCSQCPTAVNGGDIGYFPRKWMVEEEFAKAAFALPVGQISDVVQTDYGLHIIKVTDRKPGKPSDFAQIKEAVRDMCIGELALKVLAEQRKAAKIEVFLK